MVDTWWIHDTWYDVQYTISIWLGTQILLHFFPKFSTIPFICLSLFFTLPLLIFICVGACINKSYLSLSIMASLPTGKIRVMKLKISRHYKVCLWGRWVYTLSPHSAVASAQFPCRSSALFVGVLLYFCSFLCLLRDSIAWWLRTGTVLSCKTVWVWVPFLT